MIEEKGESNYDSAITRKTPVDVHPLKVVKKEEEEES